MRSPRLMMATMRRRRRRGRSPSGHPEKVIDFSYRAVHDTSEQAKAIAAAFYGKAPARSYFVGCSDGGREALMEAQRFPEDFNGILAGAPASDWSHLFTSFVWNELALSKERIPTEKLPAIQHAVVAACDAADGLKDGLVSNPLACHFDPAVLACKGADAKDCLTSAQVETLKTLYAGPKNPRTGEQLFPGLITSGAEAMPMNWPVWVLGMAAWPERPCRIRPCPITVTWCLSAPTGSSDRWISIATCASATRRSHPSSMPRTPTCARSARTAESSCSITAGATPLSSPPHRSSTTRLFDRSFQPLRIREARRSRSRTSTGSSWCPAWHTAAEAWGRYILETTRLISARRPASTDPEHDVFTALVRWVEQGVAPDQLIGSGPSPLDATKTLTRPLCPYPQQAKYKGSGDTNDAANFECAAPPK